MKQNDNKKTVRLYPIHYTDEEIWKKISELADRIKEKVPEISDVKRNAPLIQLGLTEIQRRETGEASRRATWMSIVALVIAGVALFVSIVTAYFNYNRVIRKDNVSQEQIK